MKEKLGLPHGSHGTVWPYRNIGTIHPVHRHAELEFNLVMNGSARYLLGDRRYDLERGSLVWLFPGQEHVLVETSADYRMWIAVFKPGLIRSVARNKTQKVLSRARPVGWFCKQLGRDRVQSIGQLCSELSELREQQHEMDTCNAGLAYLLLGAWSAFLNADDSHSRVLHPAVERAAALIANETEPMGLDELAYRTGLSPARLSRLFKRQTGVPLVQFRQQRQLERFFELFGRDNDMTMLNAALNAGFGSYPQFHRVFKSRMKIGPSAFFRERV